nr:septum formation protein Maf [Clostridia bacterium]
MKKLYLASASPRRHEILDIMNLPHTILTADADENIDTSLSPREAGEILAARKALAVKNALIDRGEFDGDTVIIAADTLVYIDRTPLGKPKDEGDALKMLMTLSGKVHSVCTGVCVVHGNRSISSSDASLVHMRAFDENEAKAYVATGEPLDKAGAYGIQGIGSVLVDRIDGDFFTIMGLSPKVVCRLFDKLSLPYFASVQNFSK